MTVQELIDELSSYDPDMEIKFVYDSGDYWKTELAGGIDTIEEGNVAYSSYHQTHAVVNEKWDEDDQDGDVERVLLLK